MQDTCNRRAVACNRNAVGIQKTCGRQALDICSVALDMCIRPTLVKLVVKMSALFGLERSAALPLLALVSAFADAFEIALDTILLISSSTLKTFLLNIPRRAGTCSCACVHT